MQAVEVLRAALPTPDCALIIASGYAVLIADHRVTAERVTTALGLARTALGLQIDAR